MTFLRATLATLALGLAAIPAVANGMSFDLPRLAFPGTATTGSDSSRDCTAAPLPGAPLTCAPAGS